MLKLPHSWQTEWHFDDFFAVLDSLEGKIYRNKDGRKTFRYTLEGINCFIKLHKGIGWRRIIKELLRFRMPVFSAKNEWEAIHRLRELGVETMNLVGYGCRGRNPARLQSFVITEELTHTTSLEDYCRHWKKQPPPPRLKRSLIRKIAHTSKIIHDNGINHRDFYICHFLLANVSDPEYKPENIKLHLIDLHRVQMRKHLPQRWRVKDISGLYFSSMDIGLTQRDLFRFIREYRQKGLRRSLSEDRIFWRKVVKRGITEYQEFARKHPDHSAIVKS